MATSVIPVPAPVVEAGYADINPSYTLYANNHLNVTKYGRLVVLSGYLSPTVQCPTYTMLFSIPSAYKPSGGMSIYLIPQSNPTNPIWLFGYTNGSTGSYDFSTQGQTVPVGSYYVSTCCWISAN